MKIMMIAPTPFFADRGCHTQIYREIRGLQRAGHDALLCTYGLGRDMPEVRTVRTINFPWYKKLSAGPSLTKILLLPFLTVTALKTLARYKPDIVHAHLHEGAIIARICKLFYRKPKYLFEFQGSLQKETSNHGFFKKHGVLYRFFGWLENRIMSWHFIVVGSSEMLKEVKAMKGVKPDHVASIGYSVDIERFAPGVYPKELAQSIGIDETMDVALYMGLLEEYQGVDVMLDAFRMVCERKPQTKLIVIGFPNIEKYKEMCLEYGILDNTIFLGRINYNDIPRYLSLSKIAIAPKISVTEGDGKLYDYMAMGMAIVTFDRSVSREIMDDCGIYAGFLNTEEHEKELMKEPINKSANKLANELANNLENNLENNLANSLANNLENNLENNLADKLANGLANNLENNLANSLANNLAEKLLWFFDNPQEAQAYGLKARERAVRCFSAEAMIERLESVYMRL